MIDRIAALGGRMLRVVFRAVLFVRRPRPIHPHGVALEGTVTWLAGAVPAGIDWIDRPPPGGSQPVNARLSRSAGLPAPLPDVIGLAFRVTTSDGPADVELASTGFGFPSRFWLAPQRSPSKARLTTLLPYRGTHGPVLLAARTITPGNLPSRLSRIGDELAAASWTLQLYHATATGRWHPFATLDLAAGERPADTELRFDAARHPLPGAGIYRWTLLLRDPSYRLVQG